MIHARDVLRIHLGHFTTPDDAPSRVERIVVSAFLIRHPHGLFLFDTGIGASCSRTISRSRNGAPEWGRPRAYLNTKCAMLLSRSR